MSNTLSRSPSSEPTCPVIPVVVVFLRRMMNPVMRDAWQAWRTAIQHKPGITETIAGDINFTARYLVKSNDFNPRAVRHPA